jgi:hypothetical protein
VCAFHSYLPYLVARVPFSPLHGRPTHTPHSINWTSRWAFSSFAPSFVFFLSFCLFACWLIGWLVSRFVGSQNKTIFSPDFFFFGLVLLSLILIAWILLYWLGHANTSRDWEMSAATWVFTCICWSSCRCDADGHCTTVKRDEGAFCQHSVLVYSLWVLSVRVRARGSCAIVVAVICHAQCDLVYARTSGIFLHSPFFPLPVFLSLCGVCLMPFLRVWGRMARTRNKSVTVITIIMSGYRMLLIDICVNINKTTSVSLLLFSWPSPTPPPLVYFCTCMHTQTHINRQTHTCTHNIIMSGYRMLLIDICVNINRIISVSLLVFLNPLPPPFYMCCYH